jgi:hypothetical protein
MSVVRALGQPHDQIVSNHRNHGHFLTYSGNSLGLVAEIMGRKAGVCGGIGGSQHLAFGNFRSNGVQGGMTAIGVGQALARRMRGESGVTAFVDMLSSLMRQGMKGKLTADQTGGVTVGFSSMARWKVMRHMPILAPYTSLMIAHTHETDHIASLGATYDHRVLTGGQVAAALQALSRPED